MHKASLVFILAALFAALPEAARAAEPGSGGASADPFAPSVEAKDPSSVEDQEAAVLAPQGQPAPAPPPPPPPPARRPAGRGPPGGGGRPPGPPPAPPRGGPPPGARPAG
jgi:Wiskott-Aldrich syndrome protein